jgi:hypothetical protein
MFQIGCSTDSIQAKNRGPLKLSPSCSCILWLHLNNSGDILGMNACSLLQVFVFDGLILLYTADTSPRFDLKGSDSIVLYARRLDFLNNL